MRAGVTTTTSTPENKQILRTSRSEVHPGLSICDEEEVEHVRDFLRQKLECFRGSGLSTPLMSSGKLQATRLPAALLENHSTIEFLLSSKLTNLHVFPCYST